MGQNDVDLVNLMFDSVNGLVAFGGSKF